MVLSMHRNTPWREKYKSTFFVSYIDSKVLFLLFFSLRLFRNSNFHCPFCTYGILVKQNSTELKFLLSFLYVHDSYKVEFNKIIVPFHMIKLCEAHFTL